MAVPLIELFFFYPLGILIASGILISVAAIVLLVRQERELKNAKK